MIVKEYYEKYLVLLQELKDEKSERWVYGNLGCFFKIIGDLVKVREYLMVVFNIVKERDDKWFFVKIYNNFGNIYEMEMNYEEVINCNKE